MATAQTSATTLQSRIDSTPPGGELRFQQHEEFPFSPVVIRQPIILNGNGGSISALKGPVLRVLSPNVVMRYLNVEVTGENNSFPAEDIAIAVENLEGVRFESVTVRGTISGVPGEEGAWDYPLLLELGNIQAGIETERLATITTPLPCRLESRVHDVEVEPANLSPGRHTIKVRIREMTPDVSLGGWIEISTGSIVRRIRVSGRVVAGPPTPSVGRFDATPPSVAPGEHTILHWIVNDAIRVVIEPDIGDVGALGDCVVTPLRTAQYRLRATGPGGAVTQFLTVPVVVPPPPQVGIRSFRAVPDRIVEGGSTTLYWEVDNATEVALVGAGPSPELVFPFGNRNVQPPRTLVYTLAARGRSGDVSEQASVTVLKGPWHPKPWMIILLCALAAGCGSWAMGHSLWAVLAGLTGGILSALSGEEGWIPGGALLAAALCLLLVRHPGFGVLKEILKTDGGGPVTAVGLAPDSKTAAAATDGVIRVWALPDGIRTATLKRNNYDGHISSIAFSPDGKSLASARDDTYIFLFDMVKNEYSQTLRDPRYSQPVTVVAYAGADTIVSADAQGNVLVWKPATSLVLAENVLSAHTGPVRALALAPGGAFLLSGGDDEKVVLWDLSRRPQLWTAQHPGGVLAAAVSSSLAATGGKDGVIRLWKRDSGTAEATLPAGSRVNGLAFSSDGTELISATADGRLSVWDVSSRERPHTLSAHSGSITSLAVAPASGTVVTGSSDNTVRVWHR